MYKDENHYTLCLKDGRNWGYYWYDENNKRHFRSTGRKTKHEAMKVINQRIRSGELAYNPTLKPVKFSDYTKPFFIAGSCRWLKERERTGHTVSETTLKQYRTTLEKKLIPYFGDMNLASIDQNAIKGYENKCMDEGLMLKTIAGHVHPLKLVIDTAYSENLIKENPFDGLASIKPEESTRKAFTIEQIGAILEEEWPEPMYRRIFQFACLTGMRIGEIQGLKVKHIDGGIIHISESHSDVIGKQKDTKNHKSRYTPFPVVMQDEIYRLCKGRGPEDYVFSSDGKTTFYRVACTQALKDRMKAVGIEDKDLTFHSSRHFFDTYLYVKAGVDKEKIMQVIGHSSDKMFRHYLHIEKSDLAEIAEAQNSIVK